MKAISVCSGTSTTIHDIHIDATAHGNLNHCQCTLDFLTGEESAVPGGQAVAKLSYQNTVYDHCNSVVIFSGGDNTVEFKQCSETMVTDLQLNSYILDFTSADDPQASYCVSISLKEQYKYNSIVANCTSKLPFYSLEQTTSETSTTGADKEDVSTQTTKIIDLPVEDDGDSPRHYLFILVGVFSSALAVLIFIIIVTYVVRSKNKKAEDRKKVEMSETNRPTAAITVVRIQEADDQLQKDNNHNSSEHVTQNRRVTFDEQLTAL